MGAVAAAAAIARAVKASGTIVKVEPGEFQRILTRQPGLLVVWAEGGFFFRRHRYLTNYKGLAFYCESPAPLTLPADSELVTAGRIWVP